MGDAAAAMTEEKLPDVDPGVREPFAFSILGREITVDPGREGQFWSRMAAMNFEPSTVQTLAINVRPETTFIDVGGWFGPMTLFAGYKAKRIITLEADPVALKWLRRNLSLNPEIEARTTLIDKALAPEKGVARFGTNRGKGGNSMSSLAHDTMATTWEVETVTPAEIAALAGDGPIFVKMDIEAGEYALGETLADLLDRPDAGLLLSLHPKVALGETTGLARALRWLKIGWDTRRLFRALRRYDFFHMKGWGPGRAFWTQRAVRLGLPLPPLKGDWAFFQGDKFLRD